MSAGNSTTTSMQVSLSKVGLGYGIAIAVGILVLVSTIMLASYVCMRLHQAVDGRQNENNAAVVPHHHNHHQAAAADGNGNGSGGGGLADWVVAGLDQATLESYPKLAFSSAQPLPHLQEDDTSCSICLADYKEGRQTDRQFSQRACWLLAAAGCCWLLMYWNFLASISSRNSKTTKGFSLAAHR